MGVRSISHSTSRIHWHCHALPDVHLQSRAAAGPPRLILPPTSISPAPGHESPILLRFRERLEAVRIAGLADAGPP